MGNQVIVGNGTSVSTNKRSATINGKEIPFNKKMKGNNVTVIDGNVFIDGYELVEGQWRKTLKALWYKWTF
jgi:uncharacterized protein YxjI